MRRLGVVAGLLLAAGISLSPMAAWAEQGVAPPSFEEKAEPSECSAAATEEADAECLEYWESHINWFSWDYKGGPYQRPQHRHMPPPFFFALVNFGVFLWIMWKLAARPLADFVRARHTTIRKDLDEASALHREAETRLKEYSDKIAGLDGEINTLLTQVRAEAEHEKSRIIAEAERQAVRLKEEAEAQIQVDLRRIRQSLKADAVNAAIAAAEQILAARVTAEDQARLTERFVTEVEKPATPPVSTMRS